MLNDFFFVVFIYSLLHSIFVVIAFLDYKFSVAILYTFLIFFYLKTPHSIKKDRSYLHSESGSIQTV